MRGKDLAGGLLSIVSSIISNCGVNLQKVVHNENEARPESQQVAYTSVPRWWLGLGGVIFGAIGDFIALGLTSQALATALGGATTLWANVAIARYWLKEELNKWDVFGVMGIVIGAVMIASVTPADEDYTVDQLLDKAGSTQFRTYCVFLGLTVCGLLASVASSFFYRARENVILGINRPLVRTIDVMKGHEHEMLLRLQKCEEMLFELKETNAGKRAERLREQRTRMRRESRAVMMQSARERRAGTGDEESLLSDDDSDDKLEARLRQGGAESLLVTKEVDMPGGENKWTDAYIYAATAGTVGACSVILAGCTSKTLIAAFEGNNQWDQFAPYGFIGGMVLTITGQQALLNAALIHGPIMTTFPIFQCFFVGFGVIGGIVFYQVPMGATSIALHIVAAIFMLGGCMCLMKHGKDWYEAEEAAEAENTDDPKLLEGPGANAGGGSDVGRDYDMNSLPPINVEVQQVQQTVHSSVHSPPSSAPSGPGTDWSRAAVAAKAGLGPEAIHRPGAAARTAAPPTPQSMAELERRWRQQLDKQAKKAPQQQKEEQQSESLLAGGQATGKPRSVI